MKVLTVCGTRPELIRLSAVVPKLDSLCEHIFAFTGQNRDPLLSDIFFDELGLRRPDQHWGVGAVGFAAQSAEILARTGSCLEGVQPDRMLVLGDTNSGLSAIVAARFGVPVFHMEAGNRCFDDRVPEEVNRRIIDQCSTVLMPYTQRSRENLLREGFAPDRVLVTGNPIREVLNTHAPAIADRDVLARLDVRPREYFLATMHRAENVDTPQRLRALLDALSQVASVYGQPVLVSVHPRTAARMREFELVPGSPAVRLLPPFGFLDFVHLEQRARVVLSDSGTVQEECAIFGVPNVTLRDVTERLETIECGSNMLAGTSSDGVLRAVATALSSAPTWDAPSEYLVSNVSTTVAKILLGHLEPRWSSRAL
jgi:UDP-N-acetylglucosamine 2-epimerase (non-hydrolysing)